MERIDFLLIVAAAATLAACDGPPSGEASSSVPMKLGDPIAPIDAAVWRDLGADNKQGYSLSSMCASGLDGLEAADPTLKDRVALQVPWDIQVTKHGKLQAQCVWTGPDQRQGRIVVDVLCSNGDNDRCSRFAYATEGVRRISAVIIHHHPPPPISTAYPPGRDDLERRRSQDILAWTKNSAADQIGALRTDFKVAKIGIDADAKIPVLCGEVREPGKAWRRFAVFSIGAAANPPSPTFYWRTKPSDVHDFCDVWKEGLQWYAIPDSAMNAG